MKFKTTKFVPKQVKNDCTGQCDNCGAELGAWKWRLHESTGCTRKCALADDKREMDELLGPSPSLKKGADYPDPFGDEA